jgi:Ca2+/H+ antiporter
MKCIASLVKWISLEESMRTATAKILVSCVGLALVVPFFAISVVIGAHAMRIADRSGDNLLLLILAVAGAVLSVIHGCGKTTGGLEERSHRSSQNGESNARVLPAIHLGL